MSFDFFRRDSEDLGPPPPPFRIRPRGADFSFLGSYNRWIALGVVLIVLYIVLSVLRGLYVDWLWFDGVGLRSVYSKMLVTRVWLFFGGGALFLAIFATNVGLASRAALRRAPGGMGEAEAAALRRLYLLAVIAGSLFLAVIFGTIASGHWDTVLRGIHGQSFAVEDPQFHKDVSFFVFTLPVLRVVQGWLMGAVVLTTVAVAGLYLSRFLLVGYRPGEEVGTKTHLSLLLIAVIALFVWRYWLSIFELDFSSHGVVFGATYADVHARIPLLYVSMAFGLLTAATLVAGIFRRGVLLPIGAMGVWILVAFVGNVIYPSSVHRFSVQPNELEKERPYIERNIAMTRKAFGLDAIEERQFPAAPEVTSKEIGDNPETIQNIRLLDVRPLLQTYAQIQTIRPLYEFIDVDVDRYLIDGVRRQVMLSARELSSNRLPPDAQGWVNRRLQYSHGYGAVVSPVNEVVQEGLPQLFVKDIPVSGKITITRPEIYYGEEPEHYVIVKTKAKEFDYPVEGGNVQTVFEGRGGVQIGSFFRRWLFAWDFQDLNIAISGSLTADSRILFRRNIAERVKTLAPFLKLDRDPYLVIADGKLYWVQDAYTTTGRYPYSRPNQNPNIPSLDGANYIRNSVKVVVDAYDGSTTFYQVDTDDPIIRTYAKIFPHLLTPLDQMPPSLRTHLRYPEDLFLSQVNTYRTYHITDPGVLYNKEDIWSIPTEQLSSGTETPVQPYYVIMRIPGEPSAEFALILPLTPARRANTIAWVAARSDGVDYGKLLAFRFPTDSLVFGPRQVESRIDQDTAISSQFSLWNQSGSRVIRGNLLMIPIGAGNLFVEPIYLQAETSQLPELKRVVVANGNRIAMEPSLSRSLEVIFGAAAPSLPVADTTGSPPVASATPTPSRTPTPGGPTATPRPAGTPANVADLARQADAAYQRAQTALRNGDFATYGIEIAKVEDLIRQIVALTGGP